MTDSKDNERIIDSIITIITTTISGIKRFQRTQLAKKGYKKVRLIQKEKTILLLSYPNLELEVESEQRVTGSSLELELESDLISKLKSESDSDLDLARV